MTSLNGQITNSQLKGSSYLIHGWSCDKNGKSFDSFRILDTEGTVISDYLVKKRSKLCDELREYIKLGSEILNSAFEIEIPLKELNGFSGKRIQIVPFREESAGLPMQWIIEPKLPFPNQGLIDLVGGGNENTFLRVGFEFLNYFINKVKLSRSASILDIGCGVGRIAYALTSFLNEDGKYEGFDISPKAIEWAQREISSRYDNFAFSHFDLNHRLYNAEGEKSLNGFTLPYSDNSFDFIFLTSVFTHLSAEEIKHYLKEIERILKHGAVCLMTAFIKEEGIHDIFKYEWSGGFTNNLKNPESAVAYEKNIFHSWISELNLSEINYFPGYWKSNKFTDTYQDMFLVTKN